jgi:acetolactate synthase-1/2/3 large subunit
VIFGYPGGSVLEVYDALLDSGILHIMTRHEQAASHAADGYARATGRVGVCLATSGPGATNLVTGLVTACMDSSPVVALTGQVTSSKLGTDAFQEADITGITLPATKHSYLVKDLRALARVLCEAFHIAKSGRPGPVLVDLPSDILANTLEELNYPSAPRLPGYRPPGPGHAGHPLQVRRAIRTLAACRRPVVLAGGGVIASGGAQQLRELAEVAHLPVTASLMGLGAFPGDHPQWLGMAGMHGTYSANRALLEADAILAVGVRFDDRLTGRVDAFAPTASIIHVDIDAAEVGKNVTAHVPIVGDAAAVLGALTSQWAEQVASQEGPSWAASLQPWLEQIRKWQEEHPLRYTSPPGVIQPQAVIEELSGATGGEAVVVTDVGQNQMWVAQYYRVIKPRHLISPGGLGTMGFALPASVGVQLGRPGQLVVAVAGDGGFLMNCQELATVAEHGLPVKMVVLNNGYLGMVRQWQDQFYQRRYSSVRLFSPDFVQLAKAFGIPGRRVEHPGDVRGSLRWALDEPGPTLVEFVVNPEENVLPIIPPWAGADSIIQAGPAR